MSAAPKLKTVTIRVDSAVKAAIVEIAEQEAKPVGELLREMVTEHVARQRRLAFEAEAHRQALELAAAAQDPGSDEAAVMRELDANLEEFAGEWK